MQRLFLANHCLSAAAAFIVAIATTSSVMGQYVDHAGFTYFEDGPASQDLYGHHSPLMQVGHDGALRPLFPNRDQACEPVV